MNDRGEWPAGTRVLYASKQRGTVVARPLKMTHMPSDTAIVADGDAYVIYWPTKDVRPLTAADDAPTALEKLRAR